MNYVGCKDQCKHEIALLNVDNVFDSGKFGAGVAIKFETW